MLNPEITICEIKSLASDMADSRWYGCYYNRIFIDQSFETVWKDIVFGCNGDEPEDDVIRDVFQITTSHFLQIIRLFEIYCQNNDAKYPFPINQSTLFNSLVKKAVSHHDTFDYSDLIKIVDDDNPILFRYIRDAIVNIVYDKQLPQKLDLPPEYLVCRMIKDSLFAYVLLDILFQAKESIFTWGDEDD